MIYTANKNTLNLKSSLIFTKLHMHYIIKFILFVFEMDLGMVSYGDNSPKTIRILYFPLTGKLLPVGVIKNKMTSFLN